MDITDRMYRLTNLRRFNTLTTIKDENVAEHTFVVMSKVYELLKEYAEYITEPTGDFYECALFHDFPEHDLNDLTYDFKKTLGMNALMDIKKQEHDIYDKYNINYLYCSEVELLVKAADIYSVILYYEREISLGNDIIKRYKLLDKARERYDLAIQVLEEYLKGKVEYASQQ